MYSKIALEVSQQSHDLTHKVGSIIVKDGNIISMGWNGTPAGMSNEMRDEEGETLPYVLHAEENAICKLAKTGGSSDGATIYCTLSPCWGCAKLILQSGVKRVVYDNLHRPAPLEFLVSQGVEVKSIWELKGSLNT